MTSPRENFSQILRRIYIFNLPHNNLNADHRYLQCWANILNYTLFYIYLQTPKVVMINTFLDFLSSPCKWTSGGEKKKFQA